MTQSGERDWTVIADAKAGSYKPVSSDAGKVIRVVVTYSDGTGTGRTATSLETARVDQPGTLELSSYSDVAVGAEVTATLVDSDGGVANTVWQWYSSPKQDVPVWTVIKGAVSGSYTPVDGDAERILRVTVTYDDAVGDGRFAESPSTGIVDRPGVVTLTDQTPEVGQMVVADLSDRDGGVRNVTWQWESSPVGDDADWTTIVGAERASYTPSSLVAGKWLRAVATYDDITTGRTAASKPTKPVSRPGVVTLDSTQPVTGVTMTAVLTDADGGVTGEAWYWQRWDQTPGLWEDISGAYSDTYLPVAGDAGWLLRATVEYDDSIGAGRTAESEATFPVYPSGSVVLSPDTPVVGEPVTASFSHPYGIPEEQTWNWERSPGTGELVWSLVPGATESSYTPISGDAGYVLRATVTYEDETETERSATSRASSRVDRRGLVVVEPQSPMVGDLVTAKPAEPIAAPEVASHNFPPVFHEGAEAQREIAIGWAGATAGVSR